MPADATDYQEGVEGAGSTWQSGVQDEQAQQRFSSGADNEAATEWEQNASAAGDDYASGLADYLGVSEDDITTAGDFTGGIDEDASSEWQSRTSESAEKWADRVQATSAQEYEQAAVDAADDWATEFEEGVTS